MELQWDLSIIYDSFESKILKEDLRRAKQLIHDTTVRYESLLFDSHTDAERILFYIRTMNELDGLLLKLSSYARLKESVDENKHLARDLQGEISHILPSLNKINTPFLRTLISFSWMLKNLLTVME